MSFIFKAKLPEIPEIKTNRRIADKKPRENEWEPIHRAVDRESERFADKIEAVAERTKRRVNRNELTLGARDENENRMVASIPMDYFDEQLKEATEESIIIPFDEAGGAMIIQLPSQYRSIEWDTTTDRARRWLEEHGATLVREIGDETRNALRNEIQRAFRQGLGADQTADNIINIIGLTQRQAGAVMNFRNQMIEQGASIKRADREAKKYSKRLLRWRAENIARTELMRSANEGHLEMLRQGVEQGVLNEAEFSKEWIVTPDDRLCQYCKPMDGITAQLNEPFRTPLGDRMTAHLHPQCRCVMGVKFKK